ncbi:MAG TPA: SCO family protein [Gemmatimonadota bacterium]|nr:SCO family protein [Gemmatimonadota bacterium]
MAEGSPWPARLALGAALALALATGLVGGVVLSRSGALGGAGGSASRPAGSGGGGPGQADARAGSAAVGPGGPVVARDLGPAPSWELTDQRGRTVRSSEFEGKVQVVTFLFPYCRTYCPLIAAHLRGLEGSLRAAGLADRVQFVAFNVDPAHTGPDQMRSFLRQYGWDPDAGRMEYVTGSPEAVRRAVRDGFHVDYRRVAEEGGAADGGGAAGPGEATSAGPGGAASAGADLAPQPAVENALADSASVSYDVVHNDGLALVGPDGRIRRYYAEADRIPDERLLEDIRALAAVGGKP